MTVQVGDKKIFKRPTFLHEGIFVHSGSTVTILEIHPDSISIEFTDMEGYKHQLDGVKADELE